MPTARRPAVFGRRFARALWRLTRVYWTLPDAKRSALLLAGAIRDLAASEEAMEKRVYELLAEGLPRSTVISVVHGEAPQAYRPRRWRVAPHPHTPATLEAA